MNDAIRAIKSAIDELFVSLPGSVMIMVDGSMQCQYGSSIERRKDEIFLHLWRHDGESDVIIGQIKFHTSSTIVSIYTDRLPILTINMVDPCLIVNILRVVRNEMILVDLSERWLRMPY